MHSAKCSIVSYKFKYIKYNFMIIYLLKLWDGILLLMHIIIGQA